MADESATYRKLMLANEAAVAAGKQISSMTDYLNRFVARLDELHVDHRDPLRLTAVAARKAMIDLGIAVVVAAKKPRRSKWE